MPQARSELHHGPHRLPRGRADPGRPAQEPGSLSDAALRALERAYGRERTPERERAWLAARLRAGDLPRWRLEAAAELGHRVSAEVLGRNLPRFATCPAADGQGVLLETCRWARVLHSPRTLAGRVLASLIHLHDEPRFWERFEEPRAPRWRLELEGWLLRPEEEWPRGLEDPQGARLAEESAQASALAEELRERFFEDQASFCRVEFPEPHEHPGYVISVALLALGLSLVSRAAPLPEDFLPLALKRCLDGWAHLDAVRVRTALARDVLPWLLERGDPLAARVAERAGQVSVPGVRIS